MLFSACNIDPVSPGIAQYAPLDLDSFSFSHGAKSPVPIHTSPQEPNDSYWAKLMELEGRESLACDLAAHGRPTTAPA